MDLLLDALLFLRNSKNVCVQDSYPIAGRGRSTIFPNNFFLATSYLCSGEFVF
jgi:hypothetical protein